MSFSIRISVFLVATVVAALISEAPLACSVSPDYLVPSIGERTLVSSHVVITDGYTEGNRVRIARWLKGRGPDEINVIDPSPCNIPPSRSDRSLVFLKHSDLSSYELLSYGAFSGSADPTPAAVEEVYSVMELGLENYLRRKGAAIRVRGIFRTEGSEEWQAMLELPQTGEIVRRSVGEVIHASNARVIYIGPSKVRLEMVTYQDAGLSSPIIVELTLAR